MDVDEDEHGEQHVFAVQLPAPPGTATLLEQVAHRLPGFLYLHTIFMTSDPGKIWKRLRRQSSPRCRNGSHCGWFLDERRADKVDFCVHVCRAGAKLTCALLCGRDKDCRERTLSSRAAGRAEEVTNRSVLLRGSHLCGTRLIHPKWLTDRGTTRQRNRFLGVRFNGFQVHVVCCSRRRRRRR